MMRCPVPGCTSWMLAALAVAAAPTVARAQEQPVDSTRLRILRQLELLARPPGYDTILFRQDSLARAATEGGRPAARAGADTTLAQLTGMSGYSVTEYSGARARFGAANRVLELEASEGSRAQVRREGYEVEADSAVIFDDSTGRLRTVGQSTFTPTTGDPVESARLIYDVGQGRGSAYGAKTQYAQGGANWLVDGDMPFAAQDSTYMSHARFTSCDLETPHYHFETDQIKIVGGKMLVARPVRMYFADVPVGWLPFVAQSLSSGRSSGLLTPRFSVNDIVSTSSGYRRRVSNVGFYWAMSQYSDGLVALDWFSDTFFAATGGLQYRFNRQFLDGSLNFRRYWRTDGSTELTLNTRHNWEYDERTRFHLSGQYATSNDFVRQNSYNPRELTQSIDSEGGLSRRFDWGSVNAGANRKQYLSDDRTEWTLPSAGLSLSTITLFRAPSTQARFWNNMTWSGSSSYSRRTVARELPDTATFTYGLADSERTTASASSNLSLGRLTFRQSLNVTEAATLGVPDVILAQGDTAPPVVVGTGQPVTDIAQADLTWRSSVGYQQPLIGSTTLTPSVSVNGHMFRADTSTFAQSFVPAPTRVAFSADLKSDIYGFYPGVAGFEAIRHKVSPSVAYSWSPEREPTQLQRDVFGSTVLQPQSVLRLTVNQTWEAKRPAPQESARDSTSAGPGGRPGEPRRVQQGTTVKLLGLTTSAVEYDFVEADSTGFFLGGFKTTQLSNNISSDYLRGLSLSVVHDLFDDMRDGRRVSQRDFAPHLAQVNMSFSLGSGSGVVQWLNGLLGGDSEAAEEPPVEEPLEGRGATDEASIIPGAGTPQPRQPRASEPSRRAGGWNANLSYSLQRPRDQSREPSQMLQGTLTLRPTPNWDLSWRTAYDLERGAFNDHTIRLSRDLHRWEASFDFLQTATGNWTFRFEVSLIDNRDLKFDYNQRNIDVGLPAGR